MKKLLFILLLLPVLAALQGCGTNGCEQTRETFCIADFKSVSGMNISKLNAFGIGQGKGLDKDNNATDMEMLSENNPKTLEFILNPNAQETAIRLQMTIVEDKEQYQVNDTLFIKYQTQPYFLDMECGCSVFFNLESVYTTGHVLNSVTIKRKEITNDPNINIIIEY